MSLFKKHTHTPEPLPDFPPERYEPVIRSSICTGEKVACMRDRQSGRLQELMLIRTDADLESFCLRYRLRREDIRTIY